MLSRLAPLPRAVSSPTMLRIIAIRGLATPAAPAPAKVQFQAPKGEKGVLQYERLYSRDKRYAPQPGHEWDTPARFFSQTLKKNWELYPLYFFIGAWFIGFCYVIYWSFGKLELWIDRSKKVAPWDWERVRESYYKTNSRLYDPIGYVHNRIPIMEVLQDEMLEAAKKRGTR